MKQIVTKVLCDACGEPATHANIKIAFEKRQAVIDLCTEHYEALSGAMANYIKPVATRVNGNVTKLPTAHDTKAVRAWAQENGVELPSRGRIPNAVIEQYEAAIG